MISPHLPPGTKIVCINDEDGEAYIRKGQVYTIRDWKWAKSSWDPKGPELPGVILEETMAPPPYGSYHPRRFELAALPRALTDLLKAQVTGH